MLTCQQHGDKLRGMSEPNWLNTQEALMWRSYIDMRRRLDTLIERQIGEAGLSTADFQLLIPLSESPGDQLRARELGIGVGWDRSRLSHQLRRMELRGLITRFECPTDARGTIVALTPAGRHAIEAAAPGHVDTVRRHFIDQLSSKEIATLTGIFSRIRDAMTEIEPPCEESATEAAR